MAKELHIKIDRQIGGLYIDESGWLMSGYSAAEFDYALSEMPNPKRLIIHASSPGGDIEQGFEIYNRLQDLKKAGTEIHIINEAKAYSIMTFIAMAASPGKLFARRASMWCVHKPMVVTGWDSYNADELRKYAAELDSFESVIVGAYTSRTGMSEKEVQAYLREDLIISSEEALKQGWIDEIIDNEQATEPALQSAKMVNWKPVAFIPKNKLEEMAITVEQEDSIVDKLYNKVKGLFQNNKTEGEQPSGENQVQEGQNQEAEKSPAELENEQLKAENERLKAELEQNKTQLTDLSTQQNQTATEITNLKNELAEAKKFVPGGGNHAGLPPQNFKTGDETKPEKDSNPFNKMAKNFKK